VLQLSVQTHLGAAHHYKLGRALRAFTEDGVLILASGSFTHDLRSVDWRGSNVAHGWVSEFADWVNAALAAGRIEDMLNYRRLAPRAARNHSTQTYFLPLFVALGAGGTAATSRHQSMTFSALRMDAFEFAT
jgi:4,5-DOPA dioxygenase extradiol